VGRRLRLGPYGLAIWPARCWIGLAASGAVCVPAQVGDRPSAAASCHPMFGCRIRAPTRAVFMEAVPATGCR